MEGEIRLITDLYSDFTNAADDVRAAECLAVLIDRSVEPLVRDILRGKFRVSLQDSDERPLNQNAVDLVSEVKGLIVAKLSYQRNGNGAPAIDNLEAYVRTVTSNAANQYIRQRNPQRLRLKNQLRYLLSHDRRFSLWTTDDGSWLCSAKEIRTQGGIAQRPSGDEMRADLEASGIFPDRTELADLVSAVFDRCEHGFAFNDLVGLIYDLRKMTEPVEVAEEDLSESLLSRHENSVLNRLEQTAFLVELWGVIAQLPLRHRAALLLNLRDQDGDGMISLFPLTRVATIAQIAEMLEFPLEKFVRIWSELPWDDLTIAEYLGVTRQQVINLRQSARLTLRRRLGRT